MDQEPSVLDFIKARIRFWQHKIFDPSAVDRADTEDIKYWMEKTADPVQTSIDQASTEPPRLYPWQVLLVLVLGLLGQLSLEPHQTGERTWQVGVFLYILAGLLLIWISWQNKIAMQAWTVAAYESSSDKIGRAHV